MKALNPTNREKKRYLLIKGKEANKKEIEEAILKFIGILGWAKASPNFVKLEKPIEGIVLSINRQELDKIRASFLMSGKAIKIARVSGMIGKLR
jgi:RNase P/RNase MRP subunit POP5